jgi:AAA+ ATPase superfamily predicted ATPase
VVVTGGLPRLAAEWRDTRSGPDALSFVRTQFQDSTSPLVVLGERALAAEFPATTRARDVLTTIGSGERTFARIAERAGIDQGGLARSLATLETKRVVAVERPLSARASRLAHYRVRDPYLRFWLQFVGPSMERLLPDARLGDGTHVGGYWTRDNAVEVDVVVADRAVAPATPRPSDR